MAVHRPLSGWIASLEQGPPDGRPVMGVINDGDERADARNMARFRNAAWARTSVIADRDGVSGRVLALRAPDSSLVVELDDFGRPIAVSAEGAGLVAELEQRWAGLPADAVTVERLRGESLELRYFLLHRMGRETATPAELFHCLPWERVEAAARTTAVLLTPGGTASVPANGTGERSTEEELRHWFTPAAISLAGPLSVLRGGLRGGRAGPWFSREAAALLTGLLTVDPARLPAPTRSALSGLAGRLGTDRALHHSARLAAARLTGPVPVPVDLDLTLTVRLDSDFVLRASSGAPEETGAVLEQGPVTVDVVVTPGGAVAVELEISTTAATPVRPATDDGPLCHPVVVSPFGATAEDSAPVRYWMLLDSADDRLHGFLAVPAPEGQFDIGLDAPPVALRFLDRVPQREILASLHGNEHIGPTRWHRMIDGLPVHHPAHAALAAYETQLPS
ncbi:hypothetical protein [Streptomyces sp. NBC_01637]|uniref:hypothetical protein n=1 Tax=unclassified Streptomyces TaxID=2593676 RepID=UPI00386C85EC|nr:hypothetical protein OH719_38945 [Streptomyces sp. NBC_01653]WTD87538.1 hypothetical protein OG891_07920 [Streptomyces sp. NBC_01637]